MSNSGGVQMLRVSMAGLAVIARNAAEASQSKSAGAARTGAHARTREMGGVVVGRGGGKIMPEYVGAQQCGNGIRR